MSRPRKVYRKVTQQDYDKVLSLVKNGHTIIKAIKSIDGICSADFYDTITEAQKRELQFFKTLQATGGNYNYRKKRK